MEHDGTKGTVESNLKLIRHVLLVERIETHKFETLGHDVEGFVVRFGAQGHLIGSNLPEQKHEQHHIHHFQKSLCDECATRG